MLWEGLPCANPVCPPTLFETSDFKLYRQQDFWEAQQRTAYFHTKPKKPQKTVIHRLAYVSLEEETPPNRFNPKWKSSSEQVIVNNFCWASDSCHREAGKSSCEHLENFVPTFRKWRVFTRCSLVYTRHQMITCNYFCFRELIFWWLQLQLPFWIPSRIDSREM